MRIVYQNSNGQLLSIEQHPPIIIGQKQGFGGIPNLITSEQQFGLDGAYLVNQQPDVREMEIDGEIVTEDATTLAELRREIASILNPRLSGKLIYYSDDNEIYNINVLVEQAPIFDDIQTYNTQTFQLKFQAVDPFWSSGEEANTLVQLSSLNKAFKFPIQIISDYVFADVVSGQIQKVTNNGDTETGVIVTFDIKGNCTNPKLLNIETEEFIEFVGSYTKGTLLTINTNRGQKEVMETAADGTESNAMFQLSNDSIFLQLEIGDNYFEIQAKAGVENIYSSLNYSQKIAGV